MKKTLKGTIAVALALCATAFHGVASAPGQAASSNASALVQTLQHRGGVPSVHSLSTQAGVITIPSVVGYTETQAVSTLSNLGLVVTVSTVPSTTPKGYVDSTSLIAGSTATFGSTITVYLSSGPAKTLSQSYNVENEADLQNAIAAINGNASGSTTQSTINVISDFVISRKFDVKYDTVFNLGSKAVTVHIPSPSGTLSEMDLTAFNIVDGAVFEVTSDPGGELKVQATSTASATESITASTLIQVNGSNTDPSKVSRVVVDDADVKLTLTTSARGGYGIRAEGGIVEFKQGTLNVQGRGSGIFNHEGTVTVTGGSFVHTSAYDETVYNSGSQDTGAFDGYCLLNGGGTLSVSGGTFTVEEPPIPAAVATKLAGTTPPNLIPSTTTIPFMTTNKQAQTMAGCVGNGVGSNYYGTDGVVNITGGTFVSKNPLKAAVYTETGALNMTGGSITGAQWGVEVAGTSASMQTKFLGGEVFATGATLLGVPDVAAITIDLEQKYAGQAVYVTDDSNETRADVLFAGGEFYGANVQNAPTSTYPLKIDYGHAVLLGHNKEGTQASVSTIKIEDGTFYGLVDIHDALGTLSDPHLNISIEGGVYYNANMHNGATVVPSPELASYAVPPTVTPWPTGYDPNRYDRFVRFVRVGYQIVDWTTALGGDNIGKTVTLDTTSDVASITITTASGSVVVTRFSTLQQAILAAPVNGVVELLRDVEIDTSVEGTVVVNNNSVRLNLNGKKLTLKVPTPTSVGINVNTTSHFTITDEAGSYGEVIVSGPGVGICNQGGSATTVLRGNFELEPGSNGGTIIANEGGTVKISGGSFAVTDTSSIAGTCIANNPSTSSYESKLQIEAGSFTSNSSGMAPVRSLAGSLEISAGSATTAASFKGEGSALQIMGGVAEISGGDFSASRLTGRAISVTDEETPPIVRISGGSWRGKYSIFAGVTSPLLPIATKVSVTEGMFYGEVGGTPNVQSTPGVIDIAGGTFYTTDGNAGYDPNQTYFIRTGYLTALADDNKGRSVVMDLSMVVCTIGDEPFLTIEDAMDSIRTGSSPKVITMVKDTSISKAIEVRNKRATLNLNGHEITVNLAPSAGTFDDRCAFNVCGSSTATLNITNNLVAEAGTTGKVVVQGDASFVHVVDKASFTMNSGEIEVASSSSCYAINNEAGSVVISGGTYRASYNGPSTRGDGMGPGCLYNGPSTLTSVATARITGGTFVSNCTSSFAVVTRGGTFTIAGNPSFTGVLGAMLVDGGAPNIQNGTFTATGTGGSGIMITDDSNAGQVRILGGVFRGDNAVYMGTHQMGKTSVQCSLMASGGTFYGNVGVQPGITWNTASGFVLTGGTYYAKDGLSGKFPDPAYVGSGYKAEQSSGVGVIIAKIIDASNALVTLVGFGTRTYNGKVQVPTGSQIVVTTGGRALVEGTDYSYTFTGDTINAGEVIVVVTGKGNYSGTITTSYTINKKEINTVSDVQLDSPVYDYVPGGVNPKVVSVKDGSILVAGLPKVLVEGTDYGITAATNTGTAGTGMVGIVGMGNYTGILYKTFNVNRRDLGTVISGTSTYAVGISDLPDVVYSGQPAYATSLNLRDGEYTLDPGTDYTVTYSPANPLDVTSGIPRNVGIVTVNITGVGNYEGTRSTQYEIVARDISGTSSGIAVAPIPDQTYTGSALTPSPEVRFGNNVVLTEGVDYTVSYSNNVDVGTKTGLVTITGMGNFKGAQEALFSIVDPNNKMVVDAVPDQQWTGSAITPVLRVTIDGTEIASGMYDVTYSNNTNVGQATATVRLKNNYPGYGTPTVVAGTEAKVGFRITAKSARDVVINDIDAQPYTGSPIEPLITVRDGTYNLIKGRDYELSFPGDHTNVGQAQVTIKFINGYVGNPRTVTFNIVRNISAGTVTVSPIPAQQWTGGPIRPSVTVTDTGTGQTLVEGVHYSCNYITNVNVGLDTGQVMITGIGDYLGSSRTETFTILGSLADASISLLGGKPASAYAVSDVRVSHGGKVLTFVQDYTATVNVGGNIVEVIAVGNGLFAGSSSIKRARFEIDPITYDVKPLDPDGPSVKPDPSTDPEPGVEMRVVPDLLSGMTAEQARNALAMVELNWQITYQNSSTVSPGYVMRQSEDPFTQVAKGTTITITISLGMEGGEASAMVLVPNVVGLKESGARYALESKGLSVTVVSMSSNTVPAGEVMGQSVAAGTSVGRGTSITITVCIGVSAGGNYVTVPNVEGKTEAEAIEMLQGSGLIVRRNSASSTTVDAGKVMGQSVRPGSSVIEGSVVWITISLGGGVTPSQGGGNGGGQGGTKPTTPSSPSTPGTPSTPSGPEKEVVSTEAIPQGPNDTAAAVKRFYADGTWDVYITSFTGGVPAEGWQVVNDNWYFAYNEGKAVTGLLDFDGSVYMLSEEGTIVTGFAHDPASGDKIYLEEKRGDGFGVMAENTWLQVQDEWYHAANDGTIETGVTTVDSLKYYFDDEGRLKTGWIYNEHAGEWMYGSLADDSTWGSLMSNAWIWDGSWYYLGSNSQLSTGWVKDGNAWYYFNPTSSTGHGEMMTGWQYIGNTWYKLGNDGAMQTGWTFDDPARAWAYLSPASGAMQTGWYFVNGEGWYLSNNSGYMQTGWQMDNGSWYYLGGNGTMKTGWVWDGAWYYLNDSGQMMANAWTPDGYYVGADGRMVA